LIKKLKIKFSLWLNLLAAGVRAANFWRVPF